MSGTEVDLRPSLSVPPDEPLLMSLQNPDRCAGFPHF